MIKLKRRKKEDEIPNEHSCEEIQLKGYYRNYAFESDEDDVVDNKITANTNLPSTNALNEFIISLKNVYFKYNKKQEWILNSLTLCIPTGCIYSLLGPLNSGKTTIIKLILNLIKQPNSGLIEVLDYQNNEISKLSIGYMPQQLALYDSLSINEQLTFYGRLYLMSKDEIKLRIKQLACLLKLDCVNQLISELSKSEKHLIAFASAIIHNPSLIILDQPTFGLDPMLADLIWSNLKNELVKKLHTTILITTPHYNEARKFSHLVGFLRKGRLLEEKSPDSLLSTYNLASLDQVYLRLCKLERLKSRSTLDPVFLSIKQAVDSRIEENSINPFQLPSSSTTTPTINHSKKININTNNRQLHSMKPNLVWSIVFFSLLYKNLLRLKRRPIKLIVQLLLPIYQLILFYFAFGRDPFNLSIGILNEDKPSNLSRLFIKNLDNYFINQINYSNLTVAIQDLKRNRLVAIMHIGSEFSSLINERAQLNDSLTRADIEKSTIFLHYDLTNKFITNILQKSLSHSFHLFLHQFKKKQNRIQFKNFAFSPVEFEQPINGRLTNHQEHKIWHDFTIAGLILNITFITSFYFTCNQFVNERNSSHFEKQFLANCTSTQIVCAHLAVQLILVFLQICLILILSIELFNLIINSSLLLIICLIILVNLNAILLGIFVSSFLLLKNSYSIILISFTSLFYLLILTGSLWPAKCYSNWLHYLILLSPITLPSQGLANLFFRTSKLSNVYSGFFISFLYSILLLYLSIKKFKILI